MKAKTNENERWCRIPAQPKVKTEAFSHFSDDEEEKNKFRFEMESTFERERACMHELQ